MKYDVTTDMENELLHRIIANMEVAGSMVKVKGGLYIKENISQVHGTAPLLMLLDAPGMKQQHRQSELVSSSVRTSPGIKLRFVMWLPHLQNGITDWIEKLGGESVIDGPNMQTPGTTESLKIISGSTQPEVLV